MQLDDFRGKLSKNKLTGNPFIYKRAQYVDLLLNSDEIILGGTNSRISPPTGMLINYDSDCTGDSSTVLFFFR